ncbi:hypothetical protein, partial [Streptomyces rimosus]|uniref:hypothetical protein n=1 Tax=Streptomyces rimosus TaxID=1927 RepID=UPI001F1DAC40
RSRFTGPSGRFPSVLRFRLYQILAVLISAGAFPLSVSGSLLERDDRPAFAFRPFRLYQIHFPFRASGEGSRPVRI